MKINFNQNREKAVITGIIDAGHHMWNDKKIQSLYVEFTTIKNGKLTENVYYSFLTVNNYPESAFMIMLKSMDVDISDLSDYDLDEIIGSEVSIKIDFEKGKSPKIEIIEYYGKTSISSEDINPISFSLQKDDFDNETFDTLPDFIQKYIMSSDEYKVLR